MRKLLPPIRDDRGAAVIEMAIALPVLVMFLWGIFQLGIAFQAMAGMQHALGEGARLATICQNPTPAGVCSTASNAQIEAMINDKVFGTGVGEFDVSPIVEGADYKEMSVTFTMTPNFLFFDGPEIDITREKRVYVARPPIEDEEA